MTRPLAISLAILLTPACTKQGGEATSAAADTKSDPVPAAATAPGQDEPASAPETATATGPQFLVWTSNKDGFTTRWVAADGDGVKTLATRNALVHASGEQVFHVQRRDVKRTVKTCGCVEETFGACETTGHVMDPGLSATDLESGKNVDLLRPEPEEMFGEVYGLSLGVTGGVDGALLVRTLDSGFYCGAHQSIDGHDTLVNISSPDASPWPEIDLPRDLKMAAARGKMFDLYRDCEEGDDTLDQFVDKTMSLASLALAVRDGALQITWGFEAPVYYACSPDYVTSGETVTGPIPEASAIGLGPSLPAAVTKTFAELGSADAVGWSQIKLEPDRAAAVLAKFQALPETSWPSADQSQQDRKPDATADVRSNMSQGRTLTRSKDYAGAITAFSEAIEAKPEHARAWAERGYARLLADELAAAQSDCEHALTLESAPGFQAAVHYNLGQIFEKQGKKGPAKKAYATSVKLRPNAEVQKALDAL